MVREEWDKVKLEEKEKKETWGSKAEGRRGKRRGEGRREEERRGIFRRGKGNT